MVTDQTLPVRFLSNMEVIPTMNAGKINLNLGVQLKLTLMEDILVVNGETVEKMALSKERSISLFSVDILALLHPPIKIIKIHYYF